MTEFLDWIEPLCGLDDYEDELVGIKNCDPCDDTTEFNGTYVAERRYKGKDWPKTALSMIGKMRMHQLREAVETVLRENIPGDLIETGVWRGGACLMMRAVLAANRDYTRKVYVADSFCGLPEADNRYPEDHGSQMHCYPQLCVSLEEVKSHFAFPDHQVVFVPGWFKDTLPKLDTTFALIRLDGDMYSSTMDALLNLYDKLSPRGFIIIDDYGALPGCRQAVDKFRRNRGIADTIIEIDEEGVYWRKT